MMERLTERNHDTTHENGICCANFLSAECHSVEGDCSAGCKWEEAAWSRLADYEDTHMMPSDVMSMRMDMAIITALLHDCDVDRMRELTEAEKDGRLVVLPCKVGDTVYFALLGRIIEKQVFSIVSFSDSTRIYCGGTSEYFRPEDIGKTFFLTREEAEHALEEMRNE